MSKPTREEYLVGLAMAVALLAYLVLIIYHSPRGKEFIQWLHN